MTIVDQSTGRIHRVAMLARRPDPKGIITRDPHVVETFCGIRIALIGHPKDNPAIRTRCCS